MTSQVKSEQPQKRFAIPVDGWAVTLALLAALLVRAGVIKHVPW
ncbi:MAG TPA: hypothetical protein VIH76_05995 [Candidatus Acidoferrales bacterium]